MCIPVITDVQAKILDILPQHWICICDETGVNIMLLSRDVEKTTQRRVFVSFMGDIHASVHRKKLNAVKIKSMFGFISIKPLLDGSVDDFVLNVKFLVNEFRKYDLCVGSNSVEYESLWAKSTHGIVDTNPYGETRYDKTFRSFNCQLLILPSKWRCMQCYYLKEMLKRKYRVHCSGIKTQTPNIHLSDGEKMQNLSKVQKKLESSRRLVCRLQKKLAKVSEMPISSSNVAL